MNIQLVYNRRKLSKWVSGYGGNQTDIYEETRGEASIEGGGRVADQPTHPLDKFEETP